MVDRFRTGVMAIAVLICLVKGAFAQQTGAMPPVTADDAKFKTGEFLVNFSEKSPDSVIAQIDKRMGLKPASVVGDYVLSKEVFDVYVPKQPADSGNYGVMVSMCFPGHQWPPQAWKSVLEENHLIWIGVTVVTDPRPVEQHAGLLLDAVFNVKKLWPTDADRIYLASSTGERPISGMAFYYSDIFNGTIISPGLSWFFKIKDQDPKVGIWATDNMARPLSADWDRARKKSRFFLAMNDSDDENAVRCDDLIVHLGFKSSGFKYMKWLRVKPSDMGRYTDWQAGWFEQGVDFLDESVKPAATQPTLADRKISSAKATGALDMAQNYIAMGKYAEVRARLQKIVETYPGTPAARQAAVLVKQIVGK